ncbi:MAG: hypothetical protein O2862_00175 [Bacteroidetes bacterium]|nr:hypothetical protein [Bacteroidota bacterium]
MGTKWIFIALLAVLAFLRVTQPMFFKRWVSADLKSISEHPLNISTQILLWVSMAVFGAISLYLAGYEAHPLLFLAIPSLLFLRFSFSFLIHFLLKEEGVRAVWKLGTMTALLSLWYAFTAAFLLLLSLTGYLSEEHSRYVFLSFHVLGMVYFAAKQPGFVVFKTFGTRVYAILYLCGLEIAPLVIAVQ